MATNVQASLALEVVGDENAPNPNDLTRFSLARLSSQGSDAIINDQLPEMGFKPEDITDLYPCSPLQEGILLNASSSYAVYWIWHCVPKQKNQTVSPARLANAWRTAASKHGIFSTIFGYHPDRDGFLQFVLRNEPVPVTNMYCASEVCPTTLLEEMRRPEFKPHKPKVAVTICQSNSGEVACRFDICHTLYDAYSLFILLNDVSKLYEGADVPEPPSFSQVIRLIEETPKSQKLGFWIDFLKGVRICQFPGVYRSSVDTQMTDDHGAVQLPRGVFIEATSFCKRNNVTRSVFIHIAWALVLHYYTDLEQVCFGYMASGRDVPIKGIERICGPLANLVVSRIDLRQPLSKLFQLTGSMLKEHRRHQQTQFAEVRHSLGISKQLFNTAVNLLRPDPVNSSGANSFTFSKHSLVNPNEFDVVLEGYLEPDTVRPNIYYRTSSLTHEVAQEVGVVLTKAAEYLVSLEPKLQKTVDGSSDQAQHQETEEPPEHFFQYVAGQERSKALEFWKSKFSGVSDPGTVEHKIGTTSLTERHEQQVEIEIVKSPHGHELRTVVIAAWVVALAQLSKSDEVLFGVALREGRPTSSFVPSRILVDWTGTVENILQTIEANDESTAELSRIGLHRLRQISEEAALACNFRYVLTVNEDGGGEPGGLKSNWAYTGHAIVAQCFIKRDAVQMSLSIDQEKVGAIHREKFGQRFAHIMRQLLEVEAEGQLSSVAVADMQDLEDIWSWNAMLPMVIAKPATDLVSKQVKALPQSLAIQGWDGSFTYKELDALSTRLAHILVEMGAGTGKIIPICFEKSRWMSVAMLGVAKSGAAAAGLEPSQPEERLRSILTELNPHIILSSSKTADLARRLLDVEALVVNEELLDHEFIVEPSRPLPLVEPTAPLYIVFTSGTTGKPKGVIVTHQNYSTAVTHQCKVAGFDESSRVLDFSSYAFDAAWWNLLHTLISGGCLCVLSDDERQDDLSNCFEKYGITLSFLTPSVARHLDCRTLRTVKTLLIGGEVILPRDISTLLSIDGLQIKNMYGPSECTPMTAHCNLFKDCPIRLGRALGSCTWVVSPHDAQSLVPVGTVGELCIEGGTVGQGYLNDKIKTNAVFLRDPEWLVRGTKRYPGRHGLVYLTGDLVRYENDGTLVFVGRKDNQVKIRGQRVELLEIEQHILSYLATNPLRQDLDSEPQVIAETIQHDNAIFLVAFIALQNSSQKCGKENMSLIQRSSEGLSKYLSKILPSYMVPSAFIPLSTLPLTITGKADRDLLRKMASSTWRDYKDTAENGTEPILIAPATEMEKILHEIWAAVLNLPKEAISITTAFTRLGGDSITAMQVVSKCRSQGFLIKVSDILQAETIQELAPRCKRIASRGKQQLTITAAQEDAGLASEDFGLSPIQAKFFQLFPEGINHFNQGFALDLKRTVDASIMHKALKSVVRRHGLLRARYKKDKNGFWTQYVCADGDSSFFYGVHDVATRSEVLPVAQKSQERINIIKGPVFIVDLFNIEESQQIIVLNAHHLVIDLVSWRIIWQDIEEHVQNHTLPSQTATPFRKWCKLQAMAAQLLKPDEVLPFPVPKSDFSFWGLPLDANTRATSIDYTVELDQDFTQLLMNRCNLSLRTEPVDIILGVYAYSFIRAFPEHASTPATIFIEGHGREMSDSVPADVSGTVGWFTTMHPVPVHVAPDMIVTDAVRLAKDARRKVPGKGQPYFASRYNNEECREAFQNHDDIEMLLNFGGSYQQLESANGLFKLAKKFEDGRSLQVVSGLCKRLALIEANSAVQGGRLVTTFTINQHMKHNDRLKQWIESFNLMLKQAVHSLAQAEKVLTCSDVPLLSISDRGLLQMHECLRKQNIRPNDVMDMYPATMLQEGILLSAAMARSSYKTFWIWECVPRSPSKLLSVDQLEAAWKNVVSRHRIFSTIFIPHTEDDRYVQVVLSGVEPLVNRLQVESQCPSDVLYHMDRPETSLNKPDLAFTSCQDASGSIAFRLDINHTLIDGMSLGPLIQELSACYDEQSIRPAMQLKSLLEYTATLDKDRITRRWVEYLKDARPCEIEPPPPRRKNSVQLDTFRYIGVPNIPANCILDFCKSIGITRTVFLQVSWAMVLANLCGTTDVCFGSLASGRDAPMDGIDRVIGPLANMLISRVQLAADPITVLRTVSAHAIEHLDYQHVSLAEIQHAIGLGRRRLFNTAVTVREADNFDDEEERSIKFQYYDHQDPHEYDLLLSSRLQSDDMQVSIQIRDATVDQNYGEYAVSLLSKAVDTLLGIQLENEHTAESEGSLYARFTRAYADASTKQRISDLEKIWHWNREVPKSSEFSILDLINRSIQSYPESSAVCAWDGALTYSKLDELATTFSRRLIKLDLGINRGSLIPLCFEKSMWCAVAMLAVMKTGAASVLLDTTQPIGRLQAIVSQVASPIILCSQLNAAMAQEIGVDCHVFVVGETDINNADDSHDLESDNCSAALNSPDSDDAAYVVFTSGSTGTPKGTKITHGNITTSIVHQQAVLGISSDSRVFDFASYAFDVAWCNFFHALTSGGCLCIPSESDRRNKVEESFTLLRANYAHITPTLLRYLDLSGMCDLNVINLSGEAVLSSDVALVPGHIKVVNAYGPAETNVVTVHEISRSFPLDCSNENVPIGRGAGVCTWVIDAEEGQKLMAIGEVGELWVEGPLVGRGYLNDEEKTAASFIKNPEWLLRGSNGKDGRQGFLYRTGDLVSYDEDGILTYLGRKDTQVKIRGQRVELGEVEHQLGLALAKYNIGNKTKILVELVQPKGVDQSILAAFICVDPDDPASDSNGHNRLNEVLPILSGILEHVLPSFMVPMAYMPINEIPRTVSGKTDRKQLRDKVSAMTLQEMEAWNTKASHSRRTPRTPIEKTLQSLWAKILGISSDNISADDHFFNLGGDSLSAMRLSRLARLNDISVTVGNVFEQPVLCELAQVIEPQTGTDEKENLDLSPFSLLPPDAPIPQLKGFIAEKCQISSDKIQDILPCTPLQSSLMQRGAAKTESTCFTTAHVLELSDHTDLARFREAWDEICQRAAILRTRIIHSIQYGWLQAVLDTRIEWRVYKTLDEIQNKHRRLGGQQDMGPDTELVRFGIVKPAHDNETRRFVIQLHWAIYDGWALRMLFAEAEKIYNAAMHPNSLESMAPFVKYITQIDEQQAVNFWKRQFEGLQSSRFPPQQSITVGNEQIASIDRYRDVSMPMSEVLVEQRDYTAATIIRAALSLVIADTIQRNDAVFGATVTGRQAPVNGIDHVAGPTFATLPIRVHIDHEATVRALLISVQKQATAMIPFEQTGLDRIRRVGSGAIIACDFQTLLVIQAEIREDDPRHHSEEENSGMFTRGLIPSRHAIIELGQRTGEYPLFVECKLGMRTGNSSVSLRVCVDTEIVSMELAERFAQALLTAIEKLGCGSNLDSTLGDMKIWDSIAH